MAKCARLLTVMLNLALWPHAISFFLLELCHYYYESEFDIEAWYSIQSGLCSGKTNGFTVWKYDVLPPKVSRIYSKLGNGQGNILQGRSARMNKFSGYTQISTHYLCLRISSQSWLLSLASNDATSSLSSPLFISQLTTHVSCTCAWAGCDCQLGPELSCHGCSPTLVALPKIATPCRVVFVQPSSWGLTTLSLLYNIYYKWIGICSIQAEFSR